MAKNNPYKIATWILVGVLVLGGIVGFISFGGNDNQTGLDSVTPFSLTENSFQITDFDDYSFGTDITGMCEEKTSLNGDNIICMVSGAKLDSGTLKVDCICEKLPISITSVQIRPGQSGLNTFNR